MKKLFCSLVFAACTLLAAGVFAQTDAEHIEYARNALNVTHNCESALQYLNLVSDKGKADAEYLLCMARTHDCKMNNELALFYYNKYLEYKPANDSVKLRIAELNDMKSQKERSANEQRVAKATYQTVSKNKKKKRKNLYDSYFCLGLGYDFGFGKDAPYKNGISLNSSDGFPIIHSKAVVDFSLNAHFLLSPNKAWYAKTFGISQNDVKGLGLGYYNMLSVGISPVIFNKKNSSLTAGVMGGANLVMLPELTDYYGGYSFDNPIMLFYGFKSTYYLGDNFIFFAQYTINGHKTAHASTFSGDFDVPVNYNLLSIGVSYKFDTWGWWW